MPTKDRDDELLIMVGDIRGKMDLLLRQAESQGERLSALEGWKNKFLGIVLGSSMLASGITAKLATMLSGGSPAH